MNKKSKTALPEDYNWVHGNGALLYYKGEFVGKAISDLALYQSTKKEFSYRIYLKTPNVHPDEAFRNRAEAKEALIDLHRRVHTSPKVQLRECRNEFGVMVLEDGVEVFRDEWYTPAAEWAKAQYGLTEDQLYAMYDDYKADRNGDSDQT